jgi:hypothetical protein
MTRMVAEQGVGRQARGGITHGAFSPRFFAAPRPLALTY